MDYKTAELYSKLNSYKALVNKTSGFIRWALERVENPYVACSFGKDSSVMLDLILKETNDLPIYFFSRPETELLNNFSEVKKKWNLSNLIIIQTKGYLENGLHEETKLMKNTSYDSYFVGLRTEESVVRRITLRKYGNFYKNKNDKIRICPIAEWTTNDIATYILVNNLPVLNTYITEGFNSRTTAGIPPIETNNVLCLIKKNNVSNYNKLLKLLPNSKYYK